MDAKEEAPPAAKDCVGVHTHGEPALEPYTKKVRFHRGTREGTYQADMGHLGRATCAQRSPDRRNGRLPWYVVVKKVEIAQAATKTEVYALAEEWARAPKTKSKEPPAAAECTPVIRNGRVERQPDCKSTGVELASAKDVWLITKDQYARQGHETFEVLGANLNSEMVDGPVTVAVGQTSGVRVEPEAVIIAALGLKNGGATQIWSRTHIRAVVRTRARPTETSTRRSAKRSRPSSRSSTRARWSARERRSSAFDSCAGQAESTITAACPSPSQQRVKQSATRSSPAST